MVGYESGAPRRTEGEWAPRVEESTGAHRIWLGQHPTSYMYVHRACRYDDQQQWCGGGPNEES